MCALVPAQPLSCSASCSLRWTLETGRYSARGKQMITGQTQTYMFR